MKANVSESKSFQIWNKVQLLSCLVQFYPPWAPSAPKSGRGLFPSVSAGEWNLRPLVKIE
jgi:hypothetical protein